MLPAGLKQVFPLAVLKSSPSTLKRTPRPRFEVAVVLPCSSMGKELRSLAELTVFAESFISNLPQEKGQATVVGLSGDLGSGKTAFVKAVAKKLGITEDVLSPTFVIAKYYDLPGMSWKRLVHVDAYRIEQPEEVRALRFAELLADPRNLVMIEWPEQLGEYFPKNARTLHFRFVDETTREVG